MNETVRDFYARRVREVDASIRWTDGQMLEADVATVEEASPSSSKTWLDVGCGSGDLQEGVGKDFSFCLALDAEPQMARFFVGKSRVTFLAVEADALKGGSSSFDLVTAFGLVTCLPANSERVLYQFLASSVKPDGVAIIKNQVTHGGEIVFDGFSEQLGRPYWSRYPTQADQEDLLHEFFDSVAFSPYPDDLNRHRDTFHGAFICRRPRYAGWAP